MCKFSLAVSNVLCPRSKRCMAAALCGFLVVMSGVVSGKASAQTAHFSGTQVRVAGGGSNIFAVAVDGEGDVFFTAQNGLGSGSMLFANFANSNTQYNVSGFNTPTGMAVDASGDLFILDSGTGKIDEIVATNGSIPQTALPTVVTVATGITSTGDLAVDNRGDIFFTSVAASAVEEIVAVNGVIPPSPTIKTIGSGFRFPVGIAVDANENLYVSDTFNNSVKEIVAVNGSIPANPTILTLGSGFLEPEGLVLDKSGNLYVSDYGNNALKEIVAVNGVIPSSPAIVNLGTYSGTQAVTVDSNNLLYVGDTGNNSGGTVFKVSLTGGTFAQTNVGSSGQALSMAFTFDAAGTLGSFSVLTQGATGLDFVDAGSGSCKANTAYSSGQTCTVNVQFMPRFAGTRIGAVVLTNSTGSVIATGYVQGSGGGPQVSFLPGAESGIPGSSVSGPHGIAADGNGNIYVSDQNGVEKETYSNGSYTQTTIVSGLSATYMLAVDGAGNLYITDISNMRVLKETPTSNGYSQSTVDSGFGYPYGVAVDGAGSVYIADNVNGRVLKETPSGSSYVRSITVTGLSGPAGLAVDGSGNLYVGDGAGVRKETPVQGRYTQTGDPFGVTNPNSVAVDGTGNVYFTDSATYNVYKATPTPSGFVESTVVTDLHNILGPWGLAIDGGGNMYIAYLGGNSIVKVNFANPLTLNFANTLVGTTSADSPQTVTLENIGNADLTFPISASGNNPNITTNFTLDENAPSACPVIASGFVTAGVLAAGSSCVFPISFAPTAVGSLSGSLLLTDNNLNATGPAYASQSISLSGTATPATPTISWSAPAAITYGTALSNTQLDATASVPGTFSYSPGSGTVPTAGTQSLTVTFTPTDTANYATASATVQLTVNKASPVLSWSAPAAMTYGTALSNTQLDATASVPGTFSYSPAAGAVLSAGTQQLTVVFTPNDATNYTTATTTVQLTVTNATPTITWPTSAAITYGTALNATQLDATANVPGTFAYSPAAGTVLSVGSQMLSVVFTPTDTTNYTTANATVQLIVNKATPVLSWSAPAAISYGTALSNTQLNATANVPGTFSYSPGSGTVLTSGTQSLTVTFTPTDTTNYTTANATVQLTVNKATPVLSWPAPAAISYGTALSGTQLNATASVPGTFSYSPGPGTVLTAGAHTLTVTFTPTDLTDYATAGATVQLTVNKAAPVVSWPTPAAITYGAALGGTQLNATASVPGTFSYSPGPGTVLTAGAHTLNVTFTPTDTTDYTVATGSVQLTVNKATPVITWPTPAPIVNGTALSSVQLDATANVPGTFAYTPAAGTILPAGTNTLRVVFTANDSADYTTANGSVSLVVNPAPSFTLAASPSSLSIKQGNKAGSTISVNATNGFTGSVSLSVSGLPKNVSATFSPNPATKTSTITVTVSNSANLGNSLLTITGKSGSLVQTTTIALTVVHK